MKTNPSIDQPADQPTPENMATANQPPTVAWIPLASTINNLTDQQGNVLAVIELAPKFYPPLYQWSLTAPDHNGKRVTDYEFGEEEAKQAALNALNLLTEKQQNGTPPYRLESEPTAA